MDVKDILNKTHPAVFNPTSVDASELVAEERCPGDFGGYAKSTEGQRQSTLPA